MKQKFYILTIIFFWSVTSFAQVPDWAWAKSAGGTDTEVGNSVTVDALGNTYVTGWYTSPSITFGSYTLTNSLAFAADFFVVKYDRNGNVLMAKNFGSGGNEMGNSITTDANNYLYITGSFTCTTLTLGSHIISNIDPLGQSPDIFIAKLDTSGNVLWAKSAGGGNWDQGSCIATDTKSNVFITGSFPSPWMAFGNDTLYNNNTDTTSDIYIAKYDSNGNLLWAKSAGGDGTDGSAGIATDSSGNAYISGIFNGDTLIFGSYILTGGGDFIAKYDSLGNVLWAKRIKKSTNGCGTGGNYGIATDSNENSYITGCFASATIIFDSDTLFNISSEDIYIAKYDVSGNEIWAKRTGSIYNESGTSITTDVENNVYITGRFESPTLNFGATVLTNDSAGYTDIFVAKYDASGNVLWAKSVGGKHLDYSNSIITDKNKNVFITGGFWSPSIVFGFDTLNNIAYTDYYIAKLGNDSTAGISYLYSDAENVVFVYPNPAKNKFTISFPPATRQIKISNSLGQIVQSKIVDKEIKLDFEIKKSGIYFIQITTDKQTVTKKLIVTN